MDKHLVPGDPVLVEKIVNHLKAKGIFDEFRHECLADVDTKSSCQNLSQRVDGYTVKFLANETWNPDLNKNELRNKLRRHIDESGMLAVGADHVVEQVINPKIHQLFLPKIIEVVHQYVQQEAEKLTKKDVTESTRFSKTPTEKSDKPKPVILDPIADILSFTYSKPKHSAQTSSNVHNKPIDQVKSEKKKEEVTVQAKIAEKDIKSEKKKEDTASEKVQDVTLKVKKEEVSPAPKPQTTTPTAEKKDEVSDSTTKIPPPESSDESSSQSALLQSKAPEVKVKKETKLEEVDASVETQKKPKEEPKTEKKKAEESKVAKSEGSSHSEEAMSQKSNITSSKSGSSQSKGKLDTEKKKIKCPTQNKPSSSADPNKVKSKESSSSLSSSKLSSEKSMKSAKNSKPLKDSSPLKGCSPKLPKSEKDEGSKGKSSEAQTKSADSTGKKNVPSKPDKKESAPSKVKQSSEKQKSVKPLLHSEHSLEKLKKSSHYSSSYDSSQGSDMDKSSTSSVGAKEKQKHFSKHHKKDKHRDDSKSSSKDIKEQASDKKRSHHDSDSGADQKHKSGKSSSKYTTEKHKKSSVQTSAKIDSRSNSLGSTSSTSDSQNSSSKDNILTLSEDTSEAVPKATGKKKKPVAKESEYCKNVKNLPPPPPPPPTSSLGLGTPSSADASSMDETQSSQESESENYSSQGESSSDSEEEKEEVDVKKDLKSSAPKSLYEIFMLSSSSSEFEGFQSSPEKTPGPDQSRVSDASTSTVHTSDLSSFDDTISHTEDSDSEAEDKKVKRKLTLKEAENLLRIKAEKRRSSLMNVTPENPMSEGKSSNSSLQCSVASSEEDASQRPEPKRESRRERKLNPKYASSEYASIFNSKRTSFITKQSNHLETSPLPSPERSSDIKKGEADSKKGKDKASSSRRNLFPTSSEPQNSLKIDRDNEFEVPVTPTCSFNAMPNFKLSDGQVTSFMDKKNGSEGDATNRIALKIKMPTSKNDNQMNTEKMVKSVKRKYEGETPTAKRACNKVVPAENVANENEPLNNKTSNSGLVLSVEQKEFYQKQKGGNKGDVLNNIEHPNNTFPSNNHVADSNSND